MGGSRVKSKIKMYRNLLVTFLISGFWHGASWTFVIWGGLNGLYLIAEHAFQQLFNKTTFRLPGIISMLYVFLLINLSWIFFRSETLTGAVDIVQKILSFKGKLFTPSDPEILIYCFLAVFFIVLFEVFYENVYARRKVKSYNTLSNAFMIFLLVCIILLGVFDGGQFIYFQF
jgi:hypothetical protein